jgi:threonine synthase
VVRRLNDLGARITVCPREEGVPGDPTYHRLQRAIRSGSIPFTCQGPDNGLTIEGGETLAYEIASQPVGATMDRVLVQVGGGALASSVIQGFEEASGLGVIPRVPRVHAVQAEGGHPLDRAYRLVARRIAQRLDADAAVRSTDPAVREEFLHASQHRSEFMWPWEEEPKSVAHGILDDETYDWLAVVKGMVATGGRPVVVSESKLVDANELGRQATGVDVDHTGSAGLAGLMHLRTEGEVGSGERVVVLFTGVRRDKEGEP